MSGAPLRDRARAAVLSGALVFASWLPAHANTQGENLLFEAMHDVGGLTLDRVNTALYRYLFFDVYAAALYLPAGAETGTALADDVARRLEVVYLRDIDATDLVLAAQTVLERSVEAASLAALSTRLERLHGWFRDVAAGDRIALDFVPGQGTTLEVNGERMGSIDGTDFARAYFSIWLGDAPIDDDLRAALLAPVAGSTR